MKLLLLVAVLVCLIIAPAWAQLIFNLGNADTYTTSVNQLRDAVKLKDKKGKVVTCHGLPMLNGQDKYQLVELRGDVTITLTIHLRTLYIEGYSDQYQGTCRSFITQDASSGAEKSLCVGSKKPIRKKLPFKGSYAGLEDKAGKREFFELGIHSLKEYMKLIYGVENPGAQSQASFVLSCVEMVSEAVRFTYIQDQVKGQSEFLPNPRVISLENKWGKISDAFEVAKSDGSFVKPVEGLKNEDGTDRVVAKVSDINYDVGLLNYKPDCKIQGSIAKALSEFLTWGGDLVHEL